MATVMSAKKAELALLEGRLQLRAYRQRVIDIVDDVFENQQTFHKVSELDDGGNVIMQTVPEDQVPAPGPSRSRSMGTLPMDEKVAWTKRDRDVAAWDGPLLAARVIDIVRNRDVAACENMLKKLTIKKIRQQCFAGSCRNPTKVGRVARRTRTCASAECVG